MWTRPELRARVLADPGLLRAVVDDELVFFEEGKAKYELVQRYELSATTHAALEERLRADYSAMESMFFPDAPVRGFDELRATLREVDAAVAAWAPT